MLVRYISSTMANILQEIATFSEDAINLAMNSVFTNEEDRKKFEEDLRKIVDNV